MIVDERFVEISNYKDGWLEVYVNNELVYEGPRLDFGIPALEDILDKLAINYHQENVNL